MLKQPGNQIITRSGQCSGTWIPRRITRRTRSQLLQTAVMVLKDLTRTQQFINTCDQHFAELGHDPRLRSAQAAIVDLLPLAVRERKALLTGGEVPASVKFRAIEKVIELNGIGPQKGGQMDRHELMEFLRGANISITQNNSTVQLPANPFEGDISAYVDGRFEEIQAHEGGKIAGSVMGEQDRGDEFPAMENET